MGKFVAGHAKVGGRRPGSLNKRPSFGMLKRATSDLNRIATEVNSSLTTELAAIASEQLAAMSPVDILMDIMRRSYAAGDYKSATVVAALVAPYVNPKPVPSNASAPKDSRTGAENAADLAEIYRKHAQTEDDPEVAQSYRQLAAKCEEDAAAFAARTNQRARTPTLVAFKPAIQPAVVPLRRQPQITISLTCTGLSRITRIAAHGPEQAEAPEEAASRLLKKRSTPANRFASTISWRGQD
jgi:hypothetical protein